MSHLSVCSFAHLLTSIVAVNHPSYPNFHPLWFRIVKNREVSSGPLTCPFACLLAPFTHSLACIVAADQPRHPHFHPLWFRLVKNQDISTGPLPCPLACSLAPLIPLLQTACFTRALHCALLHSFVCSLAQLVPSSWENE